MFSVGGLQVVDGGEEDVDETELDVLRDGFADLDVQLLRQRDQPLALVSVEFDFVVIVVDVVGWKHICC